ncbi:MAG TPA: EAL domain-containing protein [Acidimicrobiia bacterium]
MLRHGEIRSLYQPIVDLATGGIVAYEALARGPVGTPLEMPGALFPAAEQAGLLAELDWACQRAALDGARTAGLGADLMLFVNVEPGLLGATVPATLASARRAAAAQFRLVLEISERAVLDDPAALLGMVRHARAEGWLLAIDDVGVNPESLSLMPLIDPDVIKLDMTIVQGQPTRATGRLLTAVLAQCERNGATILAEGIENEAHHARAIGLGASLGQGWRFGRPGPLLPSTARLTRNGPRNLALDPNGRTHTATTPSTPFALAANMLEPRPCSKDLLLAITYDIEDQAVALAADSPVLLGAFQTTERYGRRTARRYERIARSCTLTAAFAAGITSDTASRVRTGSLSPSDPLTGEWTVVVISPHFATALIARDLGDRGADHDRRFEYVITHDRGLVARAACSLLDRLPAATTAGHEHGAPVQR